MSYDLKIFTENIEPEAVNQIYTLISQAPFEGCRVRIMPDVHSGAGCVVGFTAQLKDKIIPNVLGVDLGCGMLVCELGKSNFSLSELDAFIKAKIPYGSNFRSDVGGEPLVKKLLCYGELRDFERLYGSLGTLGGGNHFIEVDEDGDGARYLVIHSGSRNLGLQVAKIYQKLAVNECKFCAVSEREDVAKTLKAQGRQDEIPAVFEEITKKYAHKTKIPEKLCYLEGQKMQDYLHDLKLCQEFASMNRRKMAEDILKFLKIHRFTSFETVHNYLDDDGVIRKGSIAAHKGQRVIIPMNMRDGCIIAVGKGNEDWNFSAPHGAGRCLSRGEAKQLISMEEYRESMKSVYSTTVCEGTLDESPMAYKPADEIMRLISPTVEIEKVIKPIYNFKAGE